MKYLILLITALFFLASCEPSDKHPEQKDVWVPQYAGISVMQEIKSLPPQSTQSGGKIYAWNAYYFQLEPNKGIHVYERTAGSAIKKYFIQVYGAQEISIKDHFLYTNNFSDLVVLDISNMSDVLVTSRTKNAFPVGASNLPPVNGYFQCVDTTKGIVIGWELKHNIPANCKY